MIIVAVTLTAESQISNIADFIPEHLASSQGIVAFVGIWVIFSVTQYYILAFVKHNNNYSKSRTQFLHLIHRIVTAAQSLLAGIIALVILQILIAQEYNTVMLYIALSISYGLWIVTLGILAKAFFLGIGQRRISWFSYLVCLWLLMSSMEYSVYILMSMNWQKEIH